MALNLLNYTPRGGTENGTKKIMNAKTFGAAKNQSAVKKKALVDVGNILHQKVLGSASKPTNYTNVAVKKKDLIKVFGDEENANVGEKPMNLKMTKQTHIGQVEAIDEPNRNEENIAPFCHCHEECEDDFADIMFKHIRLSKPEVEDLAMVWENPPILSGDDKRNICENLEPIDNSELADAVFRNFLEKDLEFLEDVQVKVPPPFFL